MEIYLKFSKGIITRSTAIKLLKPLNLLKASIKSIMQKGLLMHRVEKNSEDTPNNLILKSLNHKVESLEFPVPIIYNEDYFTYGIYTNTVMYLLFLSTLKEVLKIF